MRLWYYNRKGGIIWKQIVNYLDIPDEKRIDVLSQLLRLSFDAPRGVEVLKRELDRAQADRLPAYRFVFRDDCLIGYSFLYGQTQPNQIGGGGQSNVDELPLALAVRILEGDIAVWERHGCDQMAKVTRMLLENQKKGLGRRAEKDCR